MPKLSPCVQVTTFKYMSLQYHGTCTTSSGQGSRQITQEFPIRDIAEHQSAPRATVHAHGRGLRAQPRVGLLVVYHCGRCNVLGMPRHFRS